MVTVQLKLHIFRPMQALLVIPFIVCRGNRMSSGSGDDSSPEEKILAPQKCTVLFSLYGKGTNLCLFLAFTLTANEIGVS